MSNVACTEALAEAEASLDALVQASLEPGDVTGAMDLTRRVERIARKVRLVQIDVVDAIHAADLYQPDGHGSARVMVGFAAHLSDPEAKRRDRARRMLAAMPLVRAGVASGRIGACQVDRIGLVWVNPRVQTEFERVDAQVALLAATLPYEEFEHRLANWVREVDEDGTADRARRCQENRRARIVQEYDGGWELLGGFGSLTGAQMHRIHQAFVEAEFQADWAAAREIHGDQTTVAHLARTYDQRDADAMTRIFELAANAHAATPGGAPIDTTIVIDHETFEREIRRAMGDDLEPRPVPDLWPTDDGDEHDHAGEPCGAQPEPGDRPDGEAPTTAAPSTDDEAHDAASNDPDDTEAESSGRVHPGSEFRCETLDGSPVDPAEAVNNALTGRVRRAVIGWDGVVINMSGLHKLFTGPLRHAVMLLLTTCYWPGCRVRNDRCQTDHLDPRRNGGATNPANGRPACGRHNRLKEHGFTATVDARGRTHVYRPDGTEIDAPF
jgi:hypothetical protein